jgi:hypothetical protein
MSYSLSSVKASAECLHLCDEVAHGRIIEHISKLCQSASSDDSVWVPQLRLKFRKYDETPIAVKYSWAEAIESDNEAEEEHQDSKLMVVESGWSMYVTKVGEAAPLSFRATRPTRTVPIEGCSAEIVRVVVDACSKYASEGTASDIKFNREVVVASTDDHPSNGVCELWLKTDRSVPSLHLIDPAHKVASIASRGMDLNPSFTSGAIRFALALKAPGAMRKLRRSMCKSLSKVVVIRGGELTEDALAYRRGVMNAFGASTGRKKKQQELVSEILLNGDWRNGSRVEHIERGCCPGGRAQTVKKMLQHVIPALLKPAFKVFPRKDFKGGKSAISQIGLGLAIHSLLSNSYRDAFPSAARQDAAGGAPPPLDPLPAVGLLPAAFVDGGASAGAAGVAGDGEPDEDDGVGADDDGHDEPGNGDAVDQDQGGAEGAQRLAGGLVGASDPSIDKRAEEAKNRKLGRSFVLGKSVLDECYVSALLLGPQERTMSDVMRMSGNTWELQQMRKTAQGTQRDYKLCIFREGKMFQDYARTMQEQWIDRSRWGWMQATPTRASIAFRSFSRSMATSYENCAVRYRRWPSPFFDIVAHPDNREEVFQKLEGEPKCVLDPYVEDVVSHYAETPNGLRSPEVLLEATAIAIDADPITLSTERLHSRTRKRVKERAQTTKASLSFVTSFQSLRGRSSLRHLMQGVSRKRKLAVEVKAKAVARREATRRRKSQAKSKAGSVMKKPARSDDSQQTKPRGGGGRYRAFFSALAQQGGLSDYRTAGDRYREVARRWALLTEEQKAAYEDAGYAGTLRHRSGETNSFHADRHAVFASSRQREAASRLRAIADSARTGSSSEQGHSAIVSLSSSVVAVRASDVLAQELKEEDQRLRLTRRAEAEEERKTMVELEEFAAKETSARHLATLDIVDPSVGSFGLLRICLLLLLNVLL